MARRSLRPQLNQIRSWVREGRTDAWIAHKLEVTVQQIEAFKQDNDLVPDGVAAGAPGQDFDDEIDLRAAEEASRPPEDEDEGDAAEAPPRRRGRRGGRSRRRATAGPLEGTFDHGEEGYGLWLDPAVEDNPVYAEHWAGHRPV